MFKQILETFISKIEAADWINDDLKEKLLAKFNETEFTIESGENLSVIAKDVEKFDGKLMEMILAIQSNTADQAVASKSSNLNAIHIPIEMLRHPMFDIDQPDNINFGYLGSIISNELVQLFQYYLKSQPDVSKDFYNAQAKCSATHMSSYEVDNVSNLNGQQTADSDLEDIEGLKLSFDTFKSSNNTTTFLIGLDQFSADQLFFIAFAQGHCSIERPEKIKTLIKHSGQSIDKYRVLESLKNNQQFQNTFKCQAGQKMYRDVKQICSLF